MLEIIVVLLVLAVVGAVVVSQYMSTASFDLAARADVLKGHLRYAQGRSLNTNAVWGIHIDSASSYALFTNGNVADRVALPGENGDAVALPGGMTVTTGTASFDAWGRPCTDATALALQAGTRTLVVTYGGQSRSITITPNTGFIP